MQRDIGCHLCDSAPGTCSCEEFVECPRCHGRISARACSLCGTDGLISAESAESWEAEQAADWDEARADIAYERRMGL